MVHPDMAKERGRASFDPLQLTYVLDGGEEKTRRRRELVNLALEDTALTGGPNCHFLSVSDMYSEGIRRNMYMVHRLKELGITDPMEKNLVRKICFPFEPNPLGLHTGMFQPTLQGQASEEQKKKWLPKAERCEIIGTYAQTEMGHGTFLRGLETTATFEEKTDEFILNSPTLSSVKWWPGGLGKTCNYALVMAILYIKGKSCGMHGFMVQLRDIDIHLPMPGITVGDIGTKLGFNNLDNGYLKLDHVRVPRQDMLMRNAEVTRDGRFVNKAKHSKLAYGTMVDRRSNIVTMAAEGLAAACTIAIRYSVIRRQSELEPGGREPQILDYQTQQHKLLPNLAAAYAFWFAASQMMYTYNKMSSHILQGQVELLPELHAQSSGMKALTTNIANSGIDVCRMACGGHGYSQASGIPKIYVNTTQTCTYEGENTVLLLQTARYLMKSHGQAQTGGKLAASVSYLGQGQLSKSHLGKDFALDDLVSLYRHVAFRLVEKAARRLRHLQSQGKPQHVAWNETAVYLVEAANAHIQFLITQTFVDVIKNRVPDPAVGAVLTQLCQLYATHNIGQNSGQFVQDGILSPHQLNQVHDKELELLSALRPNAVALVDAFDMSDHLLGSVLGRYDGNVYENLYKWAQQSPLNQSEVHEAFHKYVKPFRAAAKL